MMKQLLYVLFMATGMATYSSCPRVYSSDKEKPTTQVSESFGYLGNLADETKLYIIRYVETFEHVQLSLSCTSFNRLCAPWLEALRPNGRLSLCIAYDSFKRSTGSARLSWKRLLATNKGVAFLQECLLEGGAFAVESPFNLISKIMFLQSEKVNPDHALFLWIIKSGGFITPNLIRIVIDAVEFEDFDCRSLFRIMDRPEMRPSAIKQLVVSLHAHYPNKHSSFVDAYDSILSLDQIPSSKTLYALLDALRELRIQRHNTFFYQKFLDWIVKEDYRDAIAAFIDLCPSCNGINAVATCSNLNLNTILYAPRIWCVSEERLEFTLGLLKDRYNVQELLLKLKEKVRIDKLSEEISKRLIALGPYYPEDLFTIFLSRTEGFKASKELCRVILNFQTSHCIRWNMPLIWAFLSSAVEKPIIHEKQFIALIDRREPYTTLCLAVFAEKKVWLIREMIRSKIPAIIIRYIVLKYREEFWNAHDGRDTISKERLISLGKKYDYDVETLEFIIDRFHPKEPTELLYEPDSRATKDWYEVACSDFGFIRKASTIIQEETFIGLLLYDPARWCNGDEELSFAVASLKDPALILHFLERLPRRQGITITKKTALLACQSGDLSHKILVKLLEKFPSSHSYFQKVYEYRDVHDRMNFEEKLVMLQHDCEVLLDATETPLEVFICIDYSISAAKYLEYLIVRNAPSLIIKFLILERGISISSEEYKYLAELAEKHAEKEMVLKILKSRLPRI